MNERIRELAEQAGFVLWPDRGPFGEVIDWASNYDEELEKFAELVRQDEREACAKLCDEMAAKDHHTNYYLVAANAIRARGEK